MTRTRWCMLVSILLLGLLVVARSAGASAATHLASRNLKQASNEEDADTPPTEVQESPADPDVAETSSDGSESPPSGSEEAQDEADATDLEAAGDSDVVRDDLDAPPAEGDSGEETDSSPPAEGDSENDLDAPPAEGDSGEETDSSPPAADEPPNDESSGESDRDVSEVEQSPGIESPSPPPPSPSPYLPGSCDGFCGYHSDLGCWCDELCCEYRDCCSNKAATCGGCGVSPSPPVESPSPPVESPSPPVESPSPPVVRPSPSTPSSSPSNGGSGGGSGVDAPRSLGVASLDIPAAPPLPPPPPYNPAISPQVQVQVGALLPGDVPCDDLSEDQLQDLAVSYCLKILELAGLGDVFFADQCTASCGSSRRRRMLQVNPVLFDIDFVRANEDPAAVDVANGEAQDLESALVDDSLLSAALEQTLPGTTVTSQEVSASLAEPSEGPGGDQPGPQQAPEVPGGNQTSVATSDTQNDAPNGCTDVPTPDEYTCKQQKGWGKCTADFMLQGDFCAKTCGRC